LVVDWVVGVNREVRQLLREVLAVAEQTLLREGRVLLDKETLEQLLLEIAEPVVVVRAAQV
jgi:hypothetical protein